MGVDYSTTVGYGIALFDLPAVISQGNDWVEHEEIQQWLDDNGYTHIEYDCGGNWMSGEHVHLFVLKGSLSQLDPMYDEGYRSFGNVDLTHEQGKEFLRLCMEFECPWPSSISWKLTFNVS